MAVLEGKVLGLRLDLVVGLKQPLTQLSRLSVICSFYWVTIESVLSGSISVRSRGCTASWLKTRQCIVNTTAKPRWSFQAWDSSSATCFQKQCTRVSGPAKHHTTEQRWYWPKWQEEKWQGLEMAIQILIVIYWFHFLKQNDFEKLR